MRTVILLSALVILSACADDQHSTGPANTNSLNRTSAALGDTRVSSQLPSAQGKPTDAVGFSKITTVVSTWTFNPGLSGFAHTDCPAGTTVVGGGFGYDLPDGFPTAAAPSMIGSSIVGTGWSIALMNNQPGAIAWTIEVAAYCAS